MYFQGDPTVYQTYTLNITLPVGSNPGIWGLAEMRVEDKAQNTLRADFTEIIRFEVVDLDRQVTAIAIPQAIVKISGDEQTAPAGEPLPAPLVVSVLDQNKGAYPGAPVTFEVTGGQGTLSRETTVTDSAGRAATTLTLGTGINTVLAIVAGLLPVTFTATGLAIPTSFAKLTGDDQQAAAGSPADPFVVEVKDQNNNLLEGVEVTFEVTAGEGTLSVEAVNTDGDGRAASILTLGREPGKNTVVAKVAELKPVIFTATGGALADFDLDGEVGFADFFLFADAFGASDARFDLDGSGTVDFGDFFLLADHFENPARGKLLALARQMLGLPDGLQQNHPNPFNSETVISWFQLQPGPAHVEVFALTGQRVAILHRGAQKEGVHRLHWDGRDGQGHPLASGVYLYRLVTGDRVQTRKLTLLR